MTKSFKSKKNNRKNKLSKKRIAYGGGRYVRISQKVYHKCELGDKCIESQDKVYLVWVENHDTILDIKNKLRDEYHFSDSAAQTFILLLDKRIMQDNDIIGEHQYDLNLELDLTKKTPLLHLYTPPIRPTPLDTKFRFKLLTGHRFEIPMSKDAYVGELRIKIAEKLNWNPEGFKIVCKGKQISDDGMLLKDTIIDLTTDECVILKRLHGSGSPPTLYEFQPETNTKFRFRLLSNGKKYEIPISKDDTVENLIYKIIEMFGGNLLSWKIGYKGKQILIDRTRLRDTIINLMTDDEYKILDTRSQYNEIANVMPRLYDS